MSKSLDFDLLILGKKAGYAGEGVLPKQILKYVATSMLFVPENSRFLLENILVPVDFSEQSANAIGVASQLAEKTGGVVTSQHIYEYKAQFFPYLMPEEEMKKWIKKRQRGKRIF